MAHVLVTLFDDRHILPQLLNNLFAMEVCLKFFHWVCGWNIKVHYRYWAVFLAILFIMLLKVVDEIIHFDHADKSYWAVFTYGCLLCCTRWFLTCESEWIITRDREQYFLMVLFFFLYFFFFEKDVSSSMVAWKQSLYAGYSYARLET